MGNNFFIIDGVAKNWEEAIRNCAAELLANDMVEPDFADACIAREKIYPTGLDAEVGVAIPHTTEAYVKDNAFCLARMEKPVRFKRMDDPDEETDAYFVFNLAIRDPQRQLSMLSAIMKLVQDGDYMKQCINMPLEQFREAIDRRMGLDILNYQ